MITPVGTDAKVWCHRYNLKPETQECVNCGKEFTTSIPFAEGKLRGLVAPLHECGPQFQLVTMASINKNERRAVSELAIALAGAPIKKTIDLE